jgi:hypothetical protein
LQVIKHLPLFVVSAAAATAAVCFPNLLAGDFDGRADAEKAETGADVVVKPIILGYYLLADVAKICVDPPVGRSVDFGVVARDDGHEDGNDERLDLTERITYVRPICCTIFVFDLDKN